MQVLRIPFAAGAAAGCVFVLALLFLDIGGVGALVMRDQAGYLPLVMLLPAFAALFGLAVAASSLAGRTPPRDPEPQFEPLAVRAVSAARRLRTPNR
jgi:hypothetical protein